jgi:hypothetical protein
LQEENGKLFCNIKAVSKIRGVRINASSASVDIWIVNKKGCEQGRYLLLKIGKFKNPKKRKDRD